MDKIAQKFPRILKIFGFLGVVTGFVAMVGIFLLLIKGTIDYFLVPASMPAITPVLPGMKLPGLPELSFWHWIVCILVVATIHEFSHGILARYNKLKIKSSGFGFFGPILLAFVEPNERQLSKAKPYKQLSVYAAGPFSNIITGGLFFLLLLFVMNPFLSSLYQINGINVTNLSEGYPLAEAGIEAPFIITNINGIQINSTENFINSITAIKPGDNVSIITDKGDYEIIAAKGEEDENQGFIGISNLMFERELKEDKQWIKLYLPALIWLNSLLLFLFIISIGIGLFNLLPLGPVDGGRMLLSSLAVFLHDKQKVRGIFAFVSSLCLLLIVMNIIIWIWPWLIKIFSFISAQLSWVISLF